MMVLRTLMSEDAHGHTIAKVIEHTSESVLEVEQGSLYPALHRLEDRGWLSSYWGVSEKSRSRVKGGQSRCAKSTSPSPRPWHRQNVSAV